MMPRPKSSLQSSFFALRFSLLLAVLFGVEQVMPAQQPSFSVVETTIGEMQTAMRSGRITSRAIVQQYLDRIAKYEPGSMP